MPTSLPAHIEGLLAYLRQPNEKANEDLAIAYFRKVFGHSFTRQKEAKRADGYVPGSFVLELKGDSSKWLSGLFQGLAYKNENLDFGQIVVATKNFLAIWRVEDFPEAIRAEIALERLAPNVIGTRYAKKYLHKKSSLLKTAIWNGADLFTPLFLSRPDVVVNKIGSFEQTLKKGQKVRQKLTPDNFVTTLKVMRSFFDPHQPIKAIRAFYSMIYAWNETSTIHISQKISDQATLGGELITNLVPGKRLQFKEFVESRFIETNAEISYDDYFARYDQALDAVDKGFRIKHGIFFTDLDLSRFVMWFVRQDIPKLGKNYLVIDPACGSGNLVTNWRSPLELRHKVVSEIEPELLFAVEQRMRGDSWHKGKFTVVPKVSENRGLNFLDCSANEYLEQIRRGLEEKGHAPDKPLAFLCNPPYRSDDDQTTTAITYKIHPSILEVTGGDASRERYCCFLAQMKLICERAKESGLPGESLLLLFTKSAWLTQRKTFENIRSQILGSFEHVGGALLNGKEFFDIKGSWPVAFTVWRYKGKDALLESNRSVQLLDLTWMKKADLAGIDWDESDKVEAACRLLKESEKARTIEFGASRVSIREWSGVTMIDFKRDRRKLERNQRIVGGLPVNDRRQSNKKAYGESNGGYIGFMDDLTPCRVKNSVPDKPWFRLNSQFMDSKKNRCFSGPPTHWGYCASNLETAKRLFFWYALARTFVHRPYPMWVDADDMWAPSISTRLEPQVFKTAFAIAFAENECVDAYFPASNPISGAPELFVSNPMTPLDPRSFWSAVLRPYIGLSAPPSVQNLIREVDETFRGWKALFKGQTEIPVSYKPPYSVGEYTVTQTAGLVQIKDHAVENGIESLVASFDRVQKCLRAAKDEFTELICASNGINYFGPANSQTPVLSVPDKTKFDKVLCRRLALAGLLVHDLHKDPNFGRTKLAKLVYLSDLHLELNLEGEYLREAAGPLDQRALYNERIGIESLAQKYRLFRPEPEGKMVRYRPLPDLNALEAFAVKYLGSKVEQIKTMCITFKKLNTEQSEIVATLFACWNDFLIRKRSPTEDEIMSEFLHHWHPKKSRFSRSRLVKALGWMREQGLVPTGAGKLTSVKMKDR